MKKFFKFICIMLMIYGAIKLYSSFKQLKGSSEE